MALMVFAILFVLVFTLMISSLWRIFEKAGRPGWESLIPIYNIYRLVKIGGQSGTFMLFFLIPIVSTIASIVLSIRIAERFGKSEGFGLGLFFLPLIFWPILGLGDSEYQPINETYNDTYPLPDEAEFVSEFNSNIFVNEEGETVERISLEDWN